MSEHWRDKHVLVLGLAKSGEAAAKLLHRHGANVTVNDIVPYEENEQARKLEALGIEVICGSHPLHLLDRPFSFIVKNPGIPYTNPLVSAAEKKGIPVITEIELCQQLTDAPIVAVTGSNGKTTTTTLIYEMLKGEKHRPLIAGNIGTVACEVAEKATKEETLVIEVSSFQLLGTIDFKPNVSVLLNLFDAHLDYHGTKENYVAAKEKITANQEEDDLFIYNADDPFVVSIAGRTKATLLPFSTKRVIEEGIYSDDRFIYYKKEPIIPLKEIALPGKHNVENVLAAIGAAKAIGAASDEIVRVLRTFTGVRHRLQFVAEYEGRRFYNDSKATNILATEKALQSFQEPIVLLAGGLDRGNSFDELKPHLRNVRVLVAFGETKEKLAKTAKDAGVETIVFADWIEDAVESAYCHSNRGDVILLSPACASWDQYKTFEERGERFIRAVHKLTRST